MNNNDTNMSGINGNLNPNQPNLGGYSPNPNMGGVSNGLNGVPDNNLQGIPLGSMDMGTPLSNPAPVNSATSISPQPQNSITPDVNLLNPNTPTMNPMGTPMQSNSMGSVDRLENPNLMNSSIDSLSSNGMMNPSSNVLSNTPGNINVNDNMHTMIFPNEIINSAPGNPMGGNLNQPLSSAPINNGMGNVNPLMGSNDMSGISSNGTNINPFSPNANLNPMNTPNMIGAVPTPPLATPPQNGKKKKEKKPMSKTTLILFVVLLILVIGCGVYFVLNGTKTTAPKVSIVPKDLFLDIGKTLSTNVSDYATVTGYDINSCTVDTSSIDITRMGSYEYTVTCGSTTNKGKIFLQDKVAPVVSVREVLVVPGSQVNIEDFIVSCEDSTTCSYELADTTKSLEDLTETEGTYKIDLVVSDDYDNQTKVTVTLVVTNSAPVKFMYCTPTNLPNNTLDADLKVSYNYGISSENMLVRTQKISTYTFDDETEYLNIKDGYTPTSGIAGMVGEVEFDDDNFVITLTQIMTENELSTEFNVTPFPTDYIELKEFHIDQGISCKNR